jgi:hypothetical protein
MPTLAGSRTNGVAVTVTVTDAELPETGSVTVIIGEPAATPVTTADVAAIDPDGLTVASEVSEDCQVTWTGLPDPSVTESVTVLPTATDGAAGVMVKAPDASVSVKVGYALPAGSVAIT